MSKLDYVLKQDAAEFRRLRVQAEAFAPETEIMLQRIGVPSGGRCLDLGCGVGGIVDLMAARVGPDGHVTGVDTDAGSIADARRWAASLGLDNVDFMVADIFDNELPDGQFDLVHVRYVIVNIGRADDVIAAAVRLAKPGGVVAIQEVDGDKLSCVPASPAFEHLKELLLQLFTIAGDPYAGRVIFQQLRAAGLEDVCFRPCMVGATSRDPIATFMPDTINAVREVLIGQGLVDGESLDRLVAECRDHLADPDTVSTTYGVIQAWGRKPA